MLLTDHPNLPYSFLQESHLWETLEPKGETSSDKSAFALTPSLWTSAQHPWCSAGLCSATTGQQCTGCQVWWRRGAHLIPWAVVLFTVFHSEREDLNRIKQDVFPGKQDSAPMLSPCSLKASMTSSALHRPWGGWDNWCRWVPLTHGHPLPSSVSPDRAGLWGRVTYVCHCRT